MEKTRVDDMLIEMIKPKIKEIEEKFSSGTGLTQNDINAQAISRLQQRLNLLTAKVEKLKKEQQTGRRIHKGIMKGVCRALSFMDVPSKKRFKAPKIDLDKPDYASDFFRKEYESL